MNKTKTVEFDSGKMFRMMKKVVEYRLRYYVSSTNEVMTYWNGSWQPWDYVAQRVPSLRV